MGQNKHVVLEINKGHGQLDKTFNKEHNRPSYALCLAGISSFYVTTHNYTTAVAVCVTKASTVTQSSGKAIHSEGLHMVSHCLLGHIPFSTKRLEGQVVILASARVLGS